MAILNISIRRFTHMVTETFRRQLRQESEKWWTEGLINAELYEKLADRYQFTALEQDASHRFVAILIGLGAVLLGLGGITFVAANWQDWPRSFKIFLLLTLFISVNASGFYLWRRPTNRRFQKLGHGLLLLGALLLGANLSLMSQMFHQSGNFYPLLWVWGLGVVAMAYSLRLTSLGVFAAILIGWGYGLGWLDWSIGREGFGWQFFVQHMPLLASVLFIPLADCCQSRVIFALGASLVTGSLVFNLRPLAGWGYGQLVSPGWLVAIAFVLPPALLWVYSRRLWQVRTHPIDRLPLHPASHISHSSFALQPIARRLAIWFLSIVFYVFAFHWLWAISPAIGSSTAEFAYVRNWQSLVDVTILGLITIRGWWQLLTQQRFTQPGSQLANTELIVSMLMLMAGTFIWHTEVAAIPEIATFVFNSLLFGLAIVLIRDGLALGTRSTFWSGMMLLVLSIITRMLEYNTGLLLKSIVFALCGFGVIVAGLWFERNLATAGNRKPGQSRPTR
ncbi:DUF2157 domain-containing protein [Thermocoleostomius sinensis]|uniref:DUF2157 domain-containing protein n=1 Tax=Thermocoleostomius sinensis A174 TaxID=2016057 RepID=A0A9E8Z7U7_9CYAN|nr:DUF2157 domain-containing protein [Thermocoleostomius sinensis]WAL58075.1 DUF2157 domain-containing protein [Thermocoleostomius sinensis A174]